MSFIQDWRVVLEATHEASRGPEKGAVSAQKALRGSETETRELLGGTEENSVSPMRGHWFALQANQWVFTKKKQKKNWVSGQTWYLEKIFLMAISPGGKTQIIPGTGLELVRWAFAVSWSRRRWLPSWSGRTAKKKHSHKIMSNPWFYFGGRFAN